MGSVLEAKELDEAFLFSKVLLTTNKIVSGPLILLKGGCHIVRMLKQSKRA